MAQTGIGKDAQARSWKTEKGERVGLLRFEINLREW